MYIKLRIKTPAQLESEFPNWKRDIAYGTSEWRLNRVASYHGKDITEDLPVYYKSFDSIPDEGVKLRGQNLAKRYLEWRLLESKPMHTIANGLMKIQN